LQDLGLTSSGRRTWIGEDIVGHLRRFLGLLRIINRWRSYLLLEERYDLPLLLELSQHQSIRNLQPPLLTASS
jgi:hypothetical protein